MNIYIDVNENKIIIKNRKGEIQKIYSNLSTKGKIGIAKSTKLLMYSLNKIFLNKNFNDNEYEFFINDEELVLLIKNKENNDIAKTILSEWKNSYDKNTISEIGNFLKIFSKINAKNIDYWEKSECFESQLLRAELYNLQSKCDKEIQDILHEIRLLKKQDLNNINNSTYITKLWYISQERLDIKKRIKKLNNME